MKNPALGNNGLIEVGVGGSDGNAVASESTDEVVKKMNLEEIVEENDEDDKESNEKVREGNEGECIEEKLIGRSGREGDGGIHGSKQRYGLEMDTEKTINKAEICPCVL